MAKLKIAENSPLVIPYDDVLAQPAARLRITIVGITPLLTHNPEGMNQSQGAKRGTRVPEAEVEAEAGTYRLEDGTCALKGEALRASTLGAAGVWKAKGKTTMKSILAHISVVEELLPLHYLDGKPIKEYTIDRRRAIIGKAGIIRCRPRFEEWSITFTIEYDQQLVREPKMIVDIVADAGNRMGVGDYRPQKGGIFGRYRVKEYAFL